MKERLLSLLLLFLAMLTLWMIFKDLPKKQEDSAEAITIDTVPAVSDQVIRLHILADSDSYEDQQIKLLIRDALLPYLNAVTITATSKEKALLLLKEQSGSLTDIANQTLGKLNVPYTATVTVTSLYFPVRIYGSQTYLSEDAIIFPPGIYDSVQVILGDGNGHNWWCLAYPSLCFIDASYDYVPKDTLSYKEQFATVQKSSLDRLFYGTSSEDITTDTEVTVYMGSKLWKLLKDFFHLDSQP